MDSEREIHRTGTQPFPLGGGFIIGGGVLLTALAVGFALLFVLVSVVGGPISSPLRWVIPSGLVVAACLGLVLVRSGFVERARAARAEEIAARHPGQPWYQDPHSDPRGAWASSEWGGDVGLVVLLLIVLLMAIPNFLWVTVFDPGAKPEVRLFALLVLVPDFFIYQIVTGVGTMAIRRIRFGRPYLRYQTFPFFLGETLSAHVTATVFAGEEGVQAILRCLEVRAFTQGGAHGRSTITRTYQLYEVRRALPGPFGAQDVPVTFTLPAEPPTDRGAPRPRYWEIEIRGSAPEGTVCFTVPVYARPGINAPLPSMAVPTADSRGTNPV